MRGLLIGISEAVQGQIHQIDKPEVTIGRGAGATLLVAHRSVSREHCVIRVHEDRIEIHDLKSQNGTFVNGLPVFERSLLDEDELMVGDVIFRFHIVQPGVEIPENPDEALPSFGPTLQAKNAPLAREAAVLLQVAEMSRLVQQIYRVPDAGGSEHNAGREFFEGIFSVIPSTRGALFLSRWGQGELAALVSFALESTAGIPSFAEPAMDLVMNSGIPVAGSEDGVGWIAAPIHSGERVAGMLFLDSAGERRDYGSRDVQMISALAGVLALAVENARDMEMLQTENDLLRTGAPGDNTLIGESAAMSTLRAGILKVAHTQASVLITGESGTGKEVVARAIHRNSPRSMRPFVAINCAAIAESLLESEFFGHEKGAFTGAIAQRKGRLEMADGGTVFLDEIGELALPLQAKLLRALQEREFERVGGTRTIKVDIRVLAATNRDLRKAVETGTFREDLYHRLNVVPLRIPPLRDRRDDILLLATHFLRSCSEQVGRRVTGFSREARGLMAAYEWPGNVRELRNAVERAVVMGSTEHVAPEDLPESILDSRPAAAESDSDGFHGAVRDYRKRVILAALERAGGNVAEAARALKLHPVYLHRMITSLGLR